MATLARADPGDLAADYARVRALTVAVAAPLSDADATLQPHPDASPAKWHLAHLSWFFETFVLRDHVPGYRLYDAAWPFLFNSYYEGEGARHARCKRGLISRPSLDEILAYRRHVDDALTDALLSLPAEARELVVLGLHHEQQHQELLLTDILATFWENPLRPAYARHSLENGSLEKIGQGMSPPGSRVRGNDEGGWTEGATGLIEIGAPADGFAFDVERPRHRALVHPHDLAERLVTNAEWDAFIADGGYTTPTLWLADGWAWVQAEGPAAPLYWLEDGAAFTLAGVQPRDPAAPVAHVSFYEAEAFARWAGARLPTEFEWEAGARAMDPDDGNQLDEARGVLPQPATGEGLRQMFGDVWEWTASPFLPYPGFRAAEGAVGEYNGKFTCNQFVVRGGSCATPRGHLRASLRSFFYPHQRWQFTGLRLARDG